MKPNKKTDRTVITLLILCLTFGVLFFTFSILFQNSNSPKNPNKPSGDTDTIPYPEDGYGDLLEYELLEDESGYRVIGIGSYPNTDLIIPKTILGLPVKEIGYYAFAEHDDVQVDASAPSVLSENTVDVIPISLKTKGSFELTSVTIPPSVTTIGYGAFWGCYKLEKVYFHEGLTYIDSGAFGECLSLKDIVLPNSLTELGVNVFSYCYSLTEIVIPKSIIKIGMGLFRDCRSLKNIYCEIDQKPEGWSSLWIMGCTNVTVTYGYSK